MKGIKVINFLILVTLFIAFACNTGNKKTDRPF